MKFSTLVFSVLAVAISITACNNVDFKKTRGGVPYKLFSEGKGKDSIKVGDIVKYHMIVKVKDSLIGSTYTEFPKYEQVREATDSYGDPLMDILSKSKKGDSIYYVQAMDTFIARNPKIVDETPFRKGDQVITTIRVVDVFKSTDLAQADFIRERGAASERLEQGELKSFNSNLQVQEQMKTDSKLIEDYLAASNIKAEKTPWGIYMLVTDPGQGPKPAFGKHVTVKYSGSNITGGAPFDAGVFTFQIGIGGPQGSPVKGFEEGVKQLAKGGKGKVYIPSILAYGPRGSEPKIKPNANLVFDLEILDISDTAPQQMPQVNVDTTKH